MFAVGSEVAVGERVFTPPPPRRFRLRAPLAQESSSGPLSGGGATTPATTLHVSEHRQLNQADHKVVQVVVLGDRSALLDACSGFFSDKMRISDENAETQTFGIIIFINVKIFKKVFFAVSGEKP